MISFFIYCCINVTFFIKKNYFLTNFNDCLSLINKNMIINLNNYTTLNRMKYLKLKPFGLSLISILIISLFLNSCGPLKFERADVKDSPINEADKRKRNIEQGRGFTLPGGKK